MSCKRWSKEQENYLEENWGKRPIQSLAKKLGRTSMAVELKARKLKLGATLMSQGLLSAMDLANVANVSPHTVIDFWILKYGLPAKKKVTRTSRSFWQIDINEFWEWAKEHQNRFDSRRIEPLALGPEPEWMDEKRKVDREIPRCHFKPWTTMEDQILLSMRALKCPYCEIVIKLGRTKNSLRNRVKDLQSRQGAGACQ